MKSLKLFVGSMLLSASPLLAMASRPADPNAPPPPAWVQFAPMLVIVAVFYLLLIRPQSKQRRDRDNMLNAIKKGDRIVTQGGVFATIVNVNSDSYEVKINEDTKIKIRKSAVAEVLTSEPGAATPEAITAGK